MKFFSLLIASLLLTCSSFAQNRKIIFTEGPFAKTQEMAKKQKKLIFIDAYTSWCGPCKKMANTVFKNDTVADYFNKTFINTKFDMEKGEGIALAKRYEIKAYPTFLVVDADGKLVHKVVGYQEPKEFINNISDAFNPLQTLAGMQNEFNKGNRKAEFVAKYIKALMRDQKEDEAYNAACSFMMVAPDADKFTSDGWYTISNATNGVYSPNFNFMIANRDRYKKVVEPAKVDLKIDDIAITYSYYILKMGWADSTASYRKRVEQINNKNKDIAFVFLKLAEEKSANNINGCVSILSSVWSNPEFNKTWKLLSLNFFSSLVANSASADNIKLMISLVDSYSKEVNNQYAEEIIQNRFRKPLVDALKK